MAIPVPGGPHKRAPFGILAPRSVNFFGFFRNSTSSINSRLDSSHPATSLKRPVTDSFEIFLVLKGKFPVRNGYFIRRNVNPPSVSTSGANLPIH